jgi:hypothetical protein
MKAFLRVQGAPGSSSLKLDEGRAMVRCGDHEYRILGRSGEHLVALQEDPFGSGVESPHPFRHAPGHEERTDV